jgi:hypothetical protein
MAYHEENALHDDYPDEHASGCQVYLPKTFTSKTTLRFLSKNEISVKVYTAREMVVYDDTIEDLQNWFKKNALLGKSKEQVVKSCKNYNRVEREDMVIYNHKPLSKNNQIQNPFVPKSNLSKVSINKLFRRNLSTKASDLTRSEIKQVKSATTSKFVTMDTNVINESKISALVDKLKEEVYSSLQNKKESISQFRISTQFRVAFHSGIVRSSSSVDHIDPTDKDFGVIKNAYNDN